MKQVKYGDSSFTFRYEMDPSMDIASISGVNITVTDMSGSDLIAETAATIYTATTLDAAVSYDDSTITLASGASAVTEGDRLYIASATGPEEEVVVKSYNSSTRVVTLKNNVEEDHSSGTAVRGMWATYAADFSTVTTFTAGKQMRVVWEFTGSDDPSVTETYVIALYAAGVSDFWGEYNARYPVQAEMLDSKDKDKLETIIKDEFRVELKLAGIEYDRVVDQPLMTQGIMRYGRKMVLEGSGDADKYEYEIAVRSWNEWLTRVRDNMIIWTDNDQDGAIEDSEAVVHAPRSFVRHL